MNSKSLTQTSLINTHYSHDWDPVPLKRYRSNQHAATFLATLAESIQKSLV